jgi:hypothetical protein
MKIQKAIELSDGAYEVKANFSVEEMEVIIEVGINALLQQGALPFKALNNLADFAPVSDTEQ